MDGLEGLCKNKGPMKTSLLEWSEKETLCELIEKLEDVDVYCSALYNKPHGIKIKLMDL